MLTLPAGACAVCRGETLTLLPPGRRLPPWSCTQGRIFGENTQFPFGKPPEIFLAEAIQLF